MTTITTANTASEMVRSATSTALRVAARELELYDTGDVAGADEVFVPDLIDHNPAGDRREDQRDLPRRRTAQVDPADERRSAAGVKIEIFSDTACPRAVAPD